MISIMHVMANSQKRKDLVLFGEQMADLFLSSFTTLQCILPNPPPEG